MRLNHKLREITNSGISMKRHLITKYSSLSGMLSSPKNGSSIWFESSLEKDFALSLEYNSSVVSYTEQPCTIEYYIDDKLRIYTPDFLVYFEDRKEPWLCEVKPRKELQLNFSKYKSKFRAAINFSNDNDWKFTIITEEHIRTDLVENLKFLNKYDLDFVQISCLKLILDRVKVMGMTSPAEIFETLDNATNETKSQCIYAFWYALKVQQIVCDYSARLTMNSEIWYNDEK